MTNSDLIEQEEQESAVFNMALDTLKRIGKILEEIKQLSYKTEYTMEVRQAVKISLVKHFFIQASPLLANETTKEYKTEILKLTPKITKIFTNKGFGIDPLKDTLITYDVDLEIRLDEILIELQTQLQKQNYFMPKAEDEGDF